MKGNEAGEIHSISCKRPEESGPKVHWPPGTKFPSIGSKRVGAMHLSPSSEKRCVMLYVTIAIIGIQMIFYLIYSADKDWKQIVISYGFSVSCKKIIMTSHHQY